MSDLDLIETTLLQAAKRRRLDRGLRWLWQGLLSGACIWVLLLAIYKLAPIPLQVVAFSWLIVPLGAAVGFLLGWARAVSLNDTARWVDRQRKLQERVSTALEVTGTQTSGGHEDWKTLVVSDAAKSVSGLSTKDLLPLALPPATRWALVLLILGVGLGFVPEYRTKKFVQQQQDTQAIKEAGRELANLTKRTLQTRPPAIETTKRSLEEVKELGEHMSKAQLTRSEALKDLSSVTEKLKEQTRELTQNPALRNLERAARNSSRSGSPSADLQQKLENMANQMAAKAADSEALEKFKSDLERAKDMAAKLPKGENAEAKDAQEKLNATLSDLAKKAKDLGLDLPSLSEAIAALQNLEPDQVLKDLQVAEIELEKMEQMAKALEKMQLDTQRLGKDLAEQLKLGQAEAAESTLRKMAEALKSGEANAAELETIKAEVGKALEAAKQYGEVGSELEAAMKSLGQGEKAQAGQSLANAADQLSKMAGELGDAQSLLTALESLQQASMVIANGMAFGQNQKGRGGAGRSNANPTTRSGVGTWHDENSWVYPEYSDKWDNSGIERADMDGKGVADRGEGQLADNLAPTKIKGQITPGGPMPSITMKGVSIKGNSKVEYQEMAAAAQSEAQSALNQDQVPRAYQNAVRTYFDDLKE
jgi:hypothetical protein